MRKTAVFNKYGRSMAAAGTFGLAMLAAGPVFAEALGSNYNSNIEKWLGIDPIKMLRECDLVGKIALVLLAIFSVLSWAVIIFKHLQLRQAMKQTEDFVRVCSGGTGRLDEAYKASADFPDSPLAQILREAYMELEMENWYRDGYDLDDAGKIDLARSGIERVFDRAIINEISHMESKLIFLSTTTTVCPFIGLFATVWGIMIAFNGIGTSQSVSISQLAPGLSTALMVTVGGLFCAIPASMMYNSLSNKVKILTSQMDAFAAELSNIIIKQVVKRMRQPAAGPSML